EKCLEGYTGRSGIFEFMECDAAVVEAIHSGHLSAEELRSAALRGGTFHAMEKDAGKKLASGVTSPAEIVSAMGVFNSKEPSQATGFDS
ncbi:MAG: hypothetical protein GX804_10950, partial [Lentisphaerae bacterium]|nr:hypothetical protein [Lentisphaerota bacterium]